MIENAIPLDEACARVDELFERVEKGETFIIDVYGRGYAQLSPHTSDQTTAKQEV